MWFELVYYNLNTTVFGTPQCLHQCSLTGCCIIPAAVPGMSLHQNCESMSRVFSFSSPNPVDNTSRLKRTYMNMPISAFMQVSLNEVPVEVQYRAETAVFVKNYDCLWHGLTSPDAVASKLFSEKLLGDVELDAIRSTNGHYPKNSVILSSLKKGPPGTLPKFCTILKEMPHLNHIAEKLEKGRCMYCGRQIHFY